MAKSNDNNEVKITFKAFNAEFNKGMKEMNDSTSRLRQEMKLQSEQMKNSATETEKLEASLTGLQKQYELAQQKTAATAQALEQARAQWGENSVEAQKYETKLRSTQIAEQQVANAIAERRQALESIQIAESEQASSLQRLNSLFASTGTSLDQFSDAIGSDLVRSIRNGTASARDLDQAFDKVARSALGAETDLQDVRNIISRLGNGSSLGNVSRDLKKISSNARQARSEMRDLAREIGQTGAASAGLGAAAIGGLVKGTEETAKDLAMFNTQVGNMTLNINAATKATQAQLDTMSDGFSRQESALSTSLANREKSMEVSHEKQTRSLEKAMESQYEAAESNYEAQENALEKRLSREYDAISKNLDRQENELKKSLDKEVDEFEKASEAKIKIIDKEYTERLKLIDEEKYNRIKALDNEIDSLNALTESENKALEQRENAQKRAELQKAVNSAKTSQDRSEAQRKLYEFEEKLRRDAIQNERREQIEALREQKDVIKENSDAQKEALKSETDARKEQLKEQTDKEREALKERNEAMLEGFKERKEAELSALQDSNKAQLESLRKVNKAKLDALSDEQEARKNALDQRLSAEASAVQSSHASELESFKAMNAAKLKEAEKLRMPEAEQKVGVDFEMADLFDTRVAFEAVGQDVDQVTEAFGNLVRAGYVTEEQVNAISKALAGGIISGGDTFNVEGLAESLATTTQIGEATGQLTDILEKNFSETGVTIEEFNEKLSGMETVTERADYALSVLNKAGLSDLYDAYANGNPEIIAASEAQVRLIDATDRLTTTLRPLVTQVSNLVARLFEFAADNPTITKALTVIGAAFGVLSGVILALMPVFSLLTKAFEIFGGGSGGGILGKVGSVIANLASKILPALRVAFGALTGPIGLIVTALTIAVPLIIKHWDKIVAFFKGLGKILLDLVKGAFNAVNNFIKSILEKLFGIVRGIIDKVKNLFSFSGLVDGVRNVFNKAYDMIVSPIQRARDKISEIVRTIKGFFNFKFEWPEMKIPKLKIKKGSLNPVKWFTEGFPEIDIQWFAKGGIMNSPTVFGGSGNTVFAGGEAGPEAVLPLNERVLGAIGDAIFRASNNNNAPQQPIVYNYERMLEGATFVIREEADVKKLSRELYDLQQRDRKGR